MFIKRFLKILIILLILVIERVVQSRDFFFFFFLLDGFFVKSGICSIEEVIFRRFTSRMRYFFFFFFLDDRSASLLVGPPRCLIYRNKRCSITFLLNFPPSSKFTLPTNIDKIPKNLHRIVLFLLSNCDRFLFCCR